VKRSSTIGLALTGILPAVALAAFLFQGSWGERLLAFSCAAFPAAFYLIAPGVCRNGRRSVVFPVLLGIVLLTGLFGVRFLSAAGRGADGLDWLILVLWFLPLILVSLYHAVSDRDDRLDDAIAELERRFGRRECDD
jgi:hypothetical protein